MGHDSIGIVRAFKTFRCLMQMAMNDSNCLKHVLTGDNAETAIKQLATTLSIMSENTKSIRIEKHIHKVAGK